MCRRLVQPPFVPEYHAQVRMDVNCNYDAPDPKLYLGFDLSTQQVCYW